MTGEGRRTESDYTHEAYIADISRYYDIDFYRDNGFEPFVSQTEEFYTLQNTKTIQVSHSVSKVENKHYKMPMTEYDTYAMTFTNY